MNKKEVLSEANKLISNGLQKAAIDLLQEYLESDPISPAILRALGRIYILQNQPDKAVTYLKKSLDLIQDNRDKNSRQPKYEPDGFSDEDMAFVESQTQSFPDEDYNSELDAPIQQPTLELKQRNLNDRPLLKIIAKEEDKLGPENKNENTKIIYRGKKITTVNNNTPSSKLSDSNSTQANAPNPTHVKDKLHPITAIDIGASPAVDMDDRVPSTKDSHPAQTKPENLSADNEPYKQSIVGRGSEPDCVDDEDFDPLEEEPPFLDELFEDDIGELASTFLFPLDEEPDDLTWDAFDDLEEFDELANGDFEKQVQDDGKINREQRAKQIAAEVLDKFEWDQIYLPALQQIFIKNGWGAGRVAIERLMTNDIEPECLFLAMKVREYWAQNDRYWIAFRYSLVSPVKSFYRNISWQDSLRIIECFPSLPDIEEIYCFIENTYDYWYNSNRLRRAFDSFLIFLKYRAGFINSSLPGDFEFSFFNPMGDDTGVDSDIFYNLKTPESQELLELGVQLRRWPAPPENKIILLKELKNKY